MSNFIVFDGEIIPHDKPVVPAVSRGLMYGDGVFETFRTYSGQTLFLNEHLDRLYDGLDILGIPQKEVLDNENIRSLIYQLLEKKDLLDSDAILRLQVWRDGSRGYDPDPHASAHFSLTASECPDSFSHPHLATVNVRRIPSSALPSHCKFTNSINYILAAQRAREQGADEALMQTQQERISETTIANIFWVKGDKVFTPSEQCDLIPGITRSILLQLLTEDSRWRVEEGEYSKENIFRADAVWMCNSVREVLPVSQIDEQTYDTGHPVLLSLEEKFQQFRRKNLIALHP